MGQLLKFVLSKSVVLVEVWMYQLDFVFKTSPSRIEVPTRALSYWIVVDNNCFVTRDSRDRFRLSIYKIQNKHISKKKYIYIYTVNRGNILSIPSVRAVISTGPHSLWLSFSASQFRQIHKGKQHKLPVWEESDSSSSDWSWVESFGPNVPGNEGTSSNIIQLFFDLVQPFWQSLHEFHWFVASIQKWPRPRLGIV